MGFFSLRLKLTLLIAGLFAAMALVLVTLLPGRILAFAEEGVERRARDIAMMLANSAAVGVEFEDDKGLGDVLRVAGAAPGVLYATANGEGGRRLASFQWHESFAVELPQPEGNQPVLRRHGGTLHVVAPVTTGSGARGSVVLGIDLQELEQQRARINWMVGLAAAVIILLGSLVAAAVGRALVRPIDRLTAITSRIVEEGDLTQAVPVTANDEVGLLARRFGQMVEKLRHLPLTLGELVAGVHQVTDQVSRTTAVVASGAESVSARVLDTAASMAEIAASTHEIGEKVTQLDKNARSTADSNDAMVEVTGRVTNQVQALADAVVRADAAIGDMTRAVQEIARSIGGLNSSVEDTSSAMVQMDAAIDEVDRNVQQTASLSQRVASDAQDGTRTLAKTIAGIERIREATHTVSALMETLGGHIADIDKILDVISGVANQTNLLALNAAIIASQAGEQGRAFGVVADEIKALAERTSSSTKEIAELINAVRDESAKAQRAMSQSREAVDEGVALGRSTSSALAKILESTGAASAMAKAIAVATGEQSQATKRVTISSQRIAAAIQEINRASSAQAQRCDDVLQLTSDMRERTDTVLRSAREQAESTSRITRSVTSIKEMVGRLSAAQSEQTRAAEATAEAVNVIEGIATEQSTSVRDLDQAMAVLRQRAEALHQAMRQFRV